MKFTPDLETFRSLAKVANLIPVYREITADLETPVSAYLKTARGPYSYLLESVEGGEHVARYSFIGTEPSEVLITGPGQKYGDVDPLALLQSRMDEVKCSAVEGLPRFHGGAVGYVGYEAVQYFEPKVPPLGGPGVGVPESVFMLTDALLIFDHVKQTIAVVAHARVDGDPDAAYQRATEIIEEMENRLESPLPARAHRRAPDSGGVTGDAGRDYSADAGTDRSLRSNMSREDYEEMIQVARSGIYAGELIQVVLSQRLTRRTGVPPFDLYRSLRAVNPSPYMFYLDLGEFQVVGASPELLVQVIDGDIAVHPIAGTRPRGATPEKDEALARELASDEKERAEHVMLLDLGRNDVGRVAIPGTVKVTQQLDIERYSHVMHLVSHVTGRLRPEYNAFDALRAGFPAGTVSGAPKVRAMEMIADLENDKRGLYSGAVGYFSYTGNMDTAICIRTIVLKNGVAHMQAGGGVVADSTPAGEYQESLDKIGALMRAIDHAEEIAGVR